MGCLYRFGQPRWDRFADGSGRQTDSQAGTLLIMDGEPIGERSRELLTNLRNLLLEQHKLLLDAERAEYEKANGPIAGPGPFLALVLGDPQFLWLKQISTLVVEIDEALSRRSKAD